MKEIFGENSFIGHSCYISHGLPSDTLTIEILLELPEIWTIVHQAIGSHFAYTEQSNIVCFISSLLFFSALRMHSLAVCMGKHR